ncbi:hypothetical protein Fmac_022645 [Flemingia macrophylla]|uniref:ABC transporter domain-containing protein n=1 Tax=Flemingia macrophylla TaxID=520843 RepID=A0ABD1M0A5_9FABA
MEIEEEGSGNEKGVGEMRGSDDKRGMYYVVWEDLSVVVPNFGNGHTKRLLNGLNGYAEPNRIMAIMGPSGSGKSTLLDALAGRLSRNVIMSGNVLLNGKKRRLEYGVVAYVTQEDILLGTLTVRETISYSANLRLPASMSKEEVNDMIEGVIMEMGLQECADRLIGNWHLRGISGGEKKRLSIALEILIRPSLLFLDEPTSGLDSASAYFVAQTLRNIAHDGKTVISSIHQPSSEVFSLFDHLVLLSGGQTIYFGAAQKAAEFFATAGFPCPSRRNPSDHFLRCINSDFDAVTTTMMASQRGEFKNDLIGKEFDPLEPGDPKLTGEIILKTMLGIRADNSKWWDLAAVMTILISLRVLFFFILKFKERVAPFLYSIYSKQTLQRIKKRPSFRKAPSFASKRHHPLSFQEGLNSPIH